jgi:hypothetical protein
VLAVVLLGGCSDDGKATCSTAAPQGVNDPPVPDYVGLTVSEAEAKAASEHLAFRIMCLDGENQSGTADLRQDRVNVGVDDGKVTSAWRY